MSEDQKKESVEQEEPFWDSLYELEKEFEESRDKEIRINMLPFFF